jgi:hypothetical protein
MFDITNQKEASDAHVQKIIYEILDPQHMNLEIIWKKGAGEESEKYVLTKLPNEPKRSYASRGNVG